MSDLGFLHNDPGDYLDHKVYLHDCAADRIWYRDGVLSFRFPEGIWITPHHEASDLPEVVRTDTAQVDFAADDPDEIHVTVFTRNIFKKTFVKYWDMQELMEAVNSGECMVEFYYKYSSASDCMWDGALRPMKRARFRPSQLHIPNGSVTYRWNNLRPECVW